MKQFQFKGHRVSYLESGAGTPLVFLHNGGNDHRIWDRQVAHFSRTHRVIAPDHLGYGASDKPALEYTLPLFTEMVAALVEELALAPVALIGHCIGGAMAINYAAQHPEQVSRVVAFNVATEKTLLAGPLGPIYRSFAANHAQREQFCAMLEAEARSRAETDQGLRGQYGAVEPDDAEFAAYIHELYNRPGQLRSLYNNLSNFASFGALDEFEKPAGFPPLLLIWGSANQILPAMAGAALRERLQPEQVEFIADCGHLVMRERPAEINHLLESFLTTRARPEAA